MWQELVGGVLRRVEGSWSGGEVNRLMGGFGEGLLSVDLAHGDLSRGEQRPEQHGGGASGR